MKKGKRSILTLAMMMLFTLLTVISVSAAEIKTIEPAVNKRTYQYTIKADEYVPYIPVKVSRTGEVHLDIKFKRSEEHTSELQSPWN